MESLLTAMGKFLNKFDANKSSSCRVELCEKVIQTFHVLIVSNGFIIVFSTDIIRFE